jgi:hypothetical protein
MAVHEEVVDSAGETRGEEQGKVEKGAVGVVDVEGARANAGQKVVAPVDCGQCAELADYVREMECYLEEKEGEGGGRRLGGNNCV